MIYGLGMLESGITFDYGQLVLDCEFARMIKFTLQGIPVTEGTLAVEAIKEIGQGRDFLMHPTTLKGMHSQSKPELIDRRMRSIKEPDNDIAVYDRALQKARWILANHQPEPLPTDVLEKIRTIVKEAEAEMKLIKE
jgi:trimethylamine--corrinoid protein Co-methyltransferase